MFDESEEMYQTISSSFYYADDLHSNEVDLPNINSCFHRYFGPIRQGSIRGAIASYIGLSINSSCFVFPFLLYKLGIIPAIILLLFTSITTQFIIKGFISTSLRTKLNSYQKLIEREIGTKTKIAYNILNIITMLLIMLSFLNFTDVLIFNIIKKDQTYFIIIKVISGFLVQLPLCLMKTQVNVQILAIIGFLFLVYVIAIIIYIIILELITPSSDSTLDLSLSLFTNIKWYNYFTSFSLINAGFFTQNGMLMIVNGIKNITKRRANKIIYISFSIQIVCYMFITIGGYYFNKKNNSITSLFLSKAHEDSIALSGQICLILAIYLFFPIRWNIFRNSLNCLFEENEFVKSLYIWLITFLLIILNASSPFINIMSIISIYGGIPSIIITFLLPTIISSNIFGWNNKWLFCWIFTIIFIICGFCGSIMGFLDLFQIIEFNSK